MSKQLNSMPESPEMAARRITPARIGAALGVIVMLLAIFSVTIVETGQAGVMTRTGSDQVRVIATPGIYVRLPFVERVWLIDTRLKTAEQTELQSVVTSDQQSLRLSGWMAWRVTDPAQFQTISLDKRSMEEKMLKSLEETLSAWTAGQRADVILKVQPGDMSKILLADLNQRLYPLGVSAVQVGLRQVTLSESVTSKITARMSATKSRNIEQLIDALTNDERQLITAESRTQAQVLDEAYRTAQKTRQNAEQQLLATYARQYGSSHGFVETLKAPPRVAEKTGN